MMRRSTVPLLLLSLPAWHDGALATDAFVPPEVTLSKNYMVGLQMELAGRVHHADSAESREKERAFCNGWGKPYVNPVPIEDVGRVRQVVVQMDGSSYVWTETKVDSLLDSFGCEFGPKTLRVLTIARYDGKQTKTTQYDYDRRMNVGEYVTQGDATHFKSNSSNTPLDRPPKRETGEHRVIVGIPCTMRTAIPRVMWHCLTADHPVAGRSRPISLALRNHSLELEATALIPNVKVDLGVLDGPPGFRRSKVVKESVQQPSNDVDETAPQPEGRKK